MGLIALLPVVALVLAWAIRIPIAPGTLPIDSGAFELVGTGQSLLVALFVVAGVRLIRGPRQR